MDLVTGYITDAPAGPGSLRLPGARTAVVVCATVGLLTTVTAIVLSVLPPESEPNKALAVAKVLGGTLLVMASGVLVYAFGRRRARAQGSLPR